MSIACSFLVNEEPVFNTAGKKPVTPGTMHGRVLVCRTPQLTQFAKAARHMLPGVSLCSLVSSNPRSMCRWCQYIVGRGLGCSRAHPPVARHSISGSTQREILELAARCVACRATVTQPCDEWPHWVSAPCFQASQPQAPSPVKRTNDPCCGLNIVWLFEDSCYI